MLVNNKLFNLLFKIWGREALIKEKVTRILILLNFNKHMMKTKFKKYFVQEIIILIIFPVYFQPQKLLIFTKTNNYPSFKT